jgi:hypothetical protein
MPFDHDPKDATHDEDWRRALEVRAALWRGGPIRAVGFPELLVAAVAERERLTVDLALSCLLGGELGGSCPRAPGHPGPVPDAGGIFVGERRARHRRTDPGGARRLPVRRPWTPG